MKLRELRLSRFKDSGPGNPWRHVVEAASALETLGMVELRRADALGLRDDDDGGRGVTHARTRGVRTEGRTTT
jgi:hypothetical protein